MTLINPQELTLQIPGQRLAARRWGSEQGVRVLGLHGWLDNAATFDTLAPLLPELQLVSLDLPGHGRSSHRHLSATYDFITWLPDVAAAADALGWQRFGILGHSLGAGIAGCLAGTLPQRVDRIVLIDLLGPLVETPQNAPARLARAMAMRRRAATQPRWAYPDQAGAAAHLIKANPALTHETAALLVARGTHACDDGVDWSYDPRLHAQSLLRLTEEQVQAFFHRVQCPALVIDAADGLAMDRAVFDRRLACLRQATLLEVTGGHHVHLVHPERIAPAIQAFFSGGLPQ